MGQTGFHLTNDGAAAHEISIEDFETEPGVGVTGGTIASIRREGDGFAFVWRKNLPGFANVGKWDLLECMESAVARRPASQIASVNYNVRVSAVYRDGSGLWYRSVADLMYIPTQRRLIFGPTTQYRVQPQSDSFSEPAEWPPDKGALPFAPAAESDREYREDPLPMLARTDRSNKRGPAPDVESALKVSEVIRGLPPGGSWRARLPDICEEFDNAEIRCPKTWRRKGYGSWIDCADVAPLLVIRAIEHRLKLARKLK